MSLQAQLEQLCENFLTEKENDILLNEEVANSIILLLDNEDASQLNFNAKLKFGQGITILNLFAVIALDFEDDTFLSKVLKTADLKKLKFNIKTPSGYYEGATVLWILGFMAAQDKPELLTYVLKNVPFNRLRFNTNKNQGEFDGVTPLWWIVSALVRGIDEPLELVLNNSDISKLNFNASMKIGAFKNVSSIWWLALGAKLNFPHPLEYLFLFSDISQIDFNLAPTEFDEHNGQSVLCLIVEAALSGHPVAFARVLDDVDFSKLDFTKTLQDGDNAGKSIKDLIRGTPWEAKVELKDKLLQARNLYRDTLLAGNQDFSSLESFISNIVLPVHDAAFKIDPVFASYHFAMFFYDIGDMEKFEFYAKQIPVNSERYQEVIYMLANERFMAKQENPLDMKKREDDLIAAFAIALDLNSLGQPLRQNIGYSYIYGDNAGIPSGMPHDELLDCIKGDKQTCILALKNLKEKRELEEKLKAKEAKISELEQKLKQKIKICSIL
ncbi:MAG: hypothetical protein HYX61_09215 [Gammaproteobacteria bacterium]|jgi:hypothetical protein|nr:hypothetical protein [Gammaproteobacteria bacterium]